MDNNVANYKKSNFLISAKFSSTLMENKLMALALSNRNRMVITGDTIRVSIPAVEIREAIGGNSGSFYSTLNETAKLMNDRQIGVVDEDNHRFAYYQIVQTCKYEDGELKITFNSDLTKYIHNINEQFTLLNLPVMLSFKSEYSFRLYELLRSRSFNYKYQDQSNNHWEFEYDLNELLLSLGVVDGSDDNVKKVLNLSKTPDYQKAVNSVTDDRKKKKSYTEWGDFRRYILMKAIKEINEKTDITIDFKPVKCGLGGKVVGVRFMITKEKNVEVVEKIVEPTEENVDIEDYLRDLLPVKLPTKSIRAICEKANYDKDALKKSVDVLLASRKTIDDVAAFLIKAIDDEWDAPVSFTPSKNKFKGREDIDFEQFVES